MALREQVAFVFSAAGPQQRRSEKIMRGGEVFGDMHQRNQVLPGSHRGFIVFELESKIDDLFVASDALVVLSGGFLECVESPDFFVLLQHLLTLGKALLRFGVGRARVRQGRVYAQDQQAEEKACRHWRSLGRGMKSPGA
jgi:hypothetical protein